jgi:hypothetical protein
MSVIINTHEHEDMRYDYQLCEEVDDTFYVWVSTGPISGFKAVTDIETLEEAVSELFKTIKDQEGWE